MVDPVLVTAPWRNPNQQAGPRLDDPPRSGLAHIGRDDTEVVDPERHLADVQLRIRIEAARDVREEFLVRRGDEQGSSITLPQVARRKRVAVGEARRVVPVMGVLELGVLKRPPDPPAELVMVCVIIRRVRTSRQTS